MPPTSAASAPPPAAAPGPASTRWSATRGRSRASSAPAIRACRWWWSAIRWAAASRSPPRRKGSTPTPWSSPAPAIAGGSALSPVSRQTARALAAALPDKRWTGEGFIDIRPTDNPAALDRVAADPRHFGDPSSRDLYGLVELMDRAAAAAPAVRLPTLTLMGRRDEVLRPERVRDVADTHPRQRRVPPLPRRLALAVPRPPGPAGLARRRRLRALRQPAVRRTHCTTLQTEARRWGRSARAPSPGSGRPPVTPEACLRHDGRPLLGRPRSCRCPLRGRMPGSGQRRRRVRATASSSV